MIHKVRLRTMEGKLFLKFVNCCGSVLFFSVLSGLAVLGSSQKTLLLSDFPVLSSDQGNKSLQTTVIQHLIEPIENYWNISLTKEGNRVVRVVGLDDDSTSADGKGESRTKNYRRYQNNHRGYRYNHDEEDDDHVYYPLPHGHRGGRGYGGGAGTFAFASTGGGGGWASAGGGGGGKGWGSKKGGPGGNVNNHYNPSINKYGGGGPLSFVPGKGIVPHGVGGGGASSSSSASASAGGGGRRPPPPPTEATVHIVICDISDKCHNFVHCASHTHAYLRAKDRCCVIRHQQNNKGMCCSGHFTSTDSQGNPTGRHFNAYATDKVGVPDIPESSLATAAMKGYDYKEKYQQIEDRLLELNIVVERGTAAYGHLQFFKTTPEAIRTARDNFLVIKACNYIQDTYFLSADEAGIGLQGYDFGGTVFEKTCPPTPTCASIGDAGRAHRIQSKTYRTFDGSCNNPDSPKLGQSSTPLIRLLPPDYADGIWAPRVRKDGTPLPSPRFISRSLVPDVNQPDPRYTHLLTQFGQFIDHDLSHVPIFRFGDNNGIQCCAKSGESVTGDIQHPACFPIDVPPGDPYIQGECMNFVRSMIAPRIDCTFGHADQLNQLTHWLDASQIYGNTNEHAYSLREFSGGRLKVSQDANGRMDLLPEDLQDEDADCSSGQDQHCFQAGDKRVNEQIGLTSVHTIFLREHNRIARELGHLNGHWDDEIIFQETRRIVIAEYQHIVYNEWLPIIIGRDYLVTFGILPLYEGYHNGYDSGVDASISNAFTTAAFRMGHTLVQGMYNLETGSGQTVGSLVLRDFFNNPHLLRQAGFIDLLNKGFLTQPIQRFDNFVTTELRDHLFQVSGQQGGMDLIALNIQRGRDHGLPSYNEYRDLCRVGKARDFSDLAPTIHPRKISALQGIYASVDDIDLFIGGIHETPENGAVVGPTFACIIGDQFVRSKKGDRYFHDNGDQPHSFSREQLHAVRRASMARILCDNSDEIRSVQPLAFYLPNNGFNPMLPCGSPSIPHVDLRLWRE